MESVKFRKNLKNILLLSFLAIFSMFIFSACIFTLDTPSLSKKGAYISWNKVVSASGYEVVLRNSDGEKIYQTTNTKLNLSSYVVPGEWYVKVRATTTSLIRNNSEFSNEIKFTVGNFDAPSDFALVEGANSLRATWTSVMFASSYTIKIDGPDIDENSNIQEIDIEANDNIEFNVDLTRYLTEVGDYKVSVKANKTTDGDISSSNYTEEQSYTKVEPLFAPEIKSCSVSGNGDNFVVTCSTIGNASGYVLSLFGSDKTYEITTPESGDPTFTIPTYELPKLNKNDGAQKTDIQIVYVQALSNSETYKASAFTDGTVYLGKTESAADYGNIKLTNPYSKLCGDAQFDFYVNSQSELNTLIYFANANRIVNITFYQNICGYETFANGNYISNACATYAETKNIATGITADSTNKVTCTFTYNHSSIPILCDTNKDGGNSNKQQTEYNKILSYSNLEENNTNRYSIDDTKTKLPILSKAKMNVYTSDQLYLAVQAGYCPVFVGESQAETIWQKAVDVLVGTEDSLGIIDATMTEYQKLLAIFDWVCYNSVYDYNLISRINEGNVQSYSGFYLEGIFLNKGQAVCDGISKAYSLLSNMAGLEVYKVIGTGLNNNNQPESHAWNYAGIWNESTNKYTYYMVDCTWNDIKIPRTSQEDEKETLLHRYFLVKNDGKHAESWPNKHNLTSTSYNYFSIVSQVKLNNVDCNTVLYNLTNAGDYMEALVNNLDQERINGVNYLELKISKDHSESFMTAVRTKYDDNSSWKPYTDAYNENITYNVYENNYVNLAIYASFDIQNQYTTYLIVYL